GQSDESAPDAVIQKIPPARGFRNNDKQRCRQERHRPHKAGGKERKNKKAYALDGVGVDPGPVWSNDADREGDTRRDNGEEKRKQDDDYAAEKSHGSIPEIKSSLFHHRHRSQRHALPRG